LWRILDEASPDVLFIPGYREPLALTAAFWGRINRRTNVIMFDSTAQDHPRSPIKEKFKATIAQWFFQKAFVSGKRSANYLRSLIKRQLPVEKGYDVVDNAYFFAKTSEIRRALHQDLNQRPFLFVGRLVAAKSVSLLLDAFFVYRGAGGRRPLEVVGHGPLENSLKVAASQSKFEGAVRFSGSQPYESLPNWYARAACLILPSLSEMWGLVVNEAMASGLPVLVSDRCGCVDDLVEDGVNGYVISAGSIEALVDRMQKIDSLSDEELKAMGRRSQEIIARFSVETWSNSVLRLAHGESECSAVV
jgi:glycosyltransferase involved in cell wall biosynthesis